MEGVGASRIHKARLPLIACGGEGEARAPVLVLHTLKCMQISLSSISVLLRQPLAIKKSYATSNHYLATKGGRSAYKFRKSHIQKFADFNSFLDLRIFRKCGTLRICDLWTLQIQYSIQCSNSK